MAKLVLRTHLAAPADKVWAAVQTPALLEHVAAPVLRFDPVSGATPAVWDGAHEVRLRLFGLIPLGPQVIDVSRDVSRAREGVRRIRDNGRGRLARVWDHWITIADDGRGGTAYEDAVEIRAGLLTPGVWLFAFGFYAWRQHRWRRLVARDFRIGGRAAFA